MTKIMFIHGLEGHPNGRKVTMLRDQGFEVHAPDMQMSLYRLNKSNSVTRHLLRLPEFQVICAVLFAGICSIIWASLWPSVAVLLLGVAWLAIRIRSLFAEAMHVSFLACVDIQTLALPRYNPDVLIGSSWGGAVAQELIARGNYTGPTILLAPALQEVLNMTGQGCLSSPASSHEEEAESITRLKQRSGDMPILVFHDRQDDTIPYQHSVELARDSEIELRTVSAGGHSLLDL
eukprot:CAMPEP_0201528418 /NCGR_PEP_ID=MMETSP0161_2-20130828/38297_1 /ASSEMBLY_ACC=CAM_ASM_000251 /TAXON_ID=180227 /ORGANISM="Neoparamoeba aestuarina, Strain SoJaBio B1-5/56/2" /LENGTH=233 /DNA_ID=CAMNT_0047929683 /DNA_START=49 /DNA_END=746 /DNA_ORIENTATION=+